MATINGDLRDNILRGTAEDDLLNGNAGNDFLVGGAGNDELEGGLGLDQMNGGQGDDVYFVDQIGDRILEAENGGFDTVISSSSYVLSNNVEVLGLVGTENLTGIGNQLNNIFIGNSGNNFFSGLGGDDIFLDSLGNDQFDGGNGFDTLDYQGIGQEITFQVDLKAINKGELGNDRFTGVESIIGDETYANRVEVSTSPNISIFVDLSQKFLMTRNALTGLEMSYGVTNFQNILGGEQADSVTGNDAINQLQGGAGNDTLRGLGGNDWLQGDRNDDILDGGLGNDRLEGGSGDDLLIGFGGGSDEVDQLTGGQGADFFALGDAATVFYQGDESEAIITDFDLTSDFLLLPRTAIGGETGLSLQLGNFGVGDRNALDTAVLFGNDQIAVLADVVDISIGRDVLLVEG